MSLDVSRADLCVGVVGTGAMGRGIAQGTAQGGIRAILFDAAEGGARTFSMRGVAHQLHTDAKIFFAGKTACTVKLFFIGALKLTRQICVQLRRCGQARQEVGIHQRIECRGRARQMNGA